MTLADLCDELHIHVEIHDGTEPKYTCYLVNDEDKSYAYINSEIVEVINNESDEVALQDLVKLISEKTLKFGSGRVIQLSEITEVGMDVKNPPRLYEQTKYSNIIVRVAGYSDYFCNLSKELQDEIIARTEHTSF